jgi:SAM-dependent methyltransferase
MDFYTSISEHYDFIFPYSPAQVNFVTKTLKTRKAKILDIGCGTGNLSIGLANAGYKVDAIDFDKQMVEIAKLKNKDINFQAMNMLDIAKNYKEESLDAIVSFGNTLVHLTDNNDIQSFLKSAHKILKKDGSLAIQIINYQNIIKNKIDLLPLIENENIRFERHYEFRDDKLIDFNTKLSIKATNESITNSIVLNPIFMNTLKVFMLKAGFSNIKIYGNFKMSKLDDRSIPLIICGTK